MLTLHDSTNLTKSIVKWGGIGIGAIIILVLLFRGGKLLIASLFPKAPTPPKVAFGKLPSLLFPPNSLAKQYTYDLDTVSGGLGTFPSQINVYQTIPVTPNLLNLKTARESLKSTSFSSDETPITETVYTWRDTIRTDKKISYNIVSQDFTISSDYLSYPELLTVSSVDQENALLSTTKFLTDLNLYPLDIDSEKTIVQLLSLQGSSIFAATSPSTAQLVRVDFFQQDVNKLPIVYPHPPYSTMHFLIGGENTAEIFDASFAHQTVGKENTTYPLRTVQQAFDILKDNKAYIGNYFGNSKNITIKDVYLAYYLGEEKQQFLMPVYVFSGKEGFFAYVSAIADTWIQK